MKQVVLYMKALYGPIIGESATVIPLTHPDKERVENGHPCHTTPVEKIEGTTFETKNSIYKLHNLPPDVFPLSKEEVSDAEFWGSCQ